MPCHGGVLIFMQYESRQWWRLPIWLLIVGWFVIATLDFARHSSLDPSLWWTTCALCALVTAWMANVRYIRRQRRIPVSDGRFTRLLIIGGMSAAASHFLNPSIASITSGVAFGLLTNPLLVILLPPASSEGQ